MLSPVNTVGLDTCQGGSLAKKVNKATQLTPWRKGSWLLWNGWLKCSGHHSGGPGRGKTAREIQNPLWQTEPRVGHKPKDRKYFYLAYLWNQNTLHAWNVTNRCSYFPNQSREACRVIFFTVSRMGWDLNLALVPLQDAFTPNYGLLTFKLINEEHTGKPASAGGVNGVPMLLDWWGSDRSRCDIVSLQCL